MMQQALEKNPEKVPQREPISGFIICFNEEAYIEDCIRSLDFCDEVLVVDSLSSDRTVEIARELGARIIERPWPGYREQKAFALSQTSHEWVINLDADERVSPELRENIIELLTKERQIAEEGADAESRPVGYFINRLVYYLGRWWKRGGWYPEYRLRVFKKSQVEWGGVDPHEKPIPKGKTSRMGGDIYHYTYSSMDDQIERLNKFSSLSAREEFKLGTKPSLSKLIVNPLLRSVKFYFFKKGYKEGLAGFIIAVLEGYYTFIKYAKLWEIYFNERSSSNSKKGN